MYIYMHAHEYIPQTIWTVPEIGILIDIFFLIEHI